MKPLKPSLTMSQTRPRPINIGSRPPAREIALRAYHVWEAAGRPHGRAVEHWLLAEAQLREAAHPQPTESPMSAQRYGLVLNAGIVPGGA
jgi:hypothetical protein